MIKISILAAQLFFSGIQPNIPEQTVRDSVVEYAKEFLGVTYIWAGNSPSGFDCSGYVQYVFKKFGYSIERSSSGLANAGSVVSIDSVAKGDLILFRGTNPNDNSVGHVGIVISSLNEPLQFIHASSSKKHYGVVITDYYNSGYPKRFVACRRLIVD